jgi:hypothetical protein
VVGVAHDLADREEHLPHRRVEDREIALLNSGPTCRRVSAETLTMDVPVERALARAADEQPVLRGRAYSRSTTPAIAIPNPTHMVAIPKRSPRRSSSFRSVAVMRAPVAPSGWPSEMPPPFGLMSS